MLVAEVLIAVVKGKIVLTFFDNLQIIKNKKNNLHFAIILIVL